MTTLITGPMFCGKTSQLFRYMDRDFYADNHFCIIRPCKDTRNFISHSEVINESFKGITIPLHKINKVDDYVLDQLLEYRAIYIDEAFMIEDVYKIPFTFRSKDIYISSLLASSENKVFDEIVKLLPYCEHIEKLNSVCEYCKDKNANFTYSKVKKDFEIQIGGQESYIALCSRCEENSREGD